jgi:tellurite resistance protein
LLKIGRNKVISNDEAMDVVCEASDFIANTSYESEDDWEEVKALVARLDETIKWIDKQKEN